MNIPKVGFDMTRLARGYIASGEFNGFRVPQHLQNQIVKLYCDSNQLDFVLSRAEYWINGSTKCQLWSALKEGFNDIVFFSLWQLPNARRERLQIYDYCIAHNIILHFATERIRVAPDEFSWTDLEILFDSNLTILQASNYHDYLVTLKELI